MKTPLLACVGLMLALALVLAACGDDERQPLATAQAVPSSIAARATVQATRAATATARPSPTTTPAPPTEQPSPTAMPSPTATAIPAVTATIARPPAAATPRPAQSAHSYVFPVRSKGKITYGRFHHDYPATDIFCEVGSEFLAVTDGVVDYVSREDRWDPAVDDGATRGGLSVAIIGDDGVRYYGSHLSQVADGIKPGVRVAVGQVLGLTGKSGDARNTDSHLHFGISHPTRPDDWQVRRGEIWPYDYLRAWQRGENVTPKLR